jgi:hypothetical protein
MRTDRAHGSPYDRGGADFWYWRPYRPHYFEHGSYSSPEHTDLTPEELAEYAAGWKRAEDQGDRKDWD